MMNTIHPITPEPEDDSDDFMSMLRSTIQNDTQVRQELMKLLENICILSYEGRVVTACTSLRTIREGNAPGFLLNNSLITLYHLCDSLNDAYVEGDIDAIKHWYSVIGSYQELNSTMNNYGSFRSLGELIIKSSDQSITMRQNIELIERLSECTSNNCTRVMTLCENDDELFAMIAELPFVSAELGNIALERFSDPERNDLLRKLITPKAGVDRDAQPHQVP
jgi:hypothetical protein